MRASQDDPGNVNQNKKAANSHISKNNHDFLESPNMLTNSIQQQHFHTPHLIKF